MKSTRIICICLSAILALLCAFATVACSRQNTDPVSNPAASQPGQTSSDASDVSKPDTESSSEPGPASSGDEPSRPDEPKEKPKPIDMEAVLTELVEENQGADPEALCDILLENPYFTLFRKYNTTFGYPGISDYEIKNVKKSCTLVYSQTSSALIILEPKNAADAENLASELKSHANLNWAWLPEDSKLIPDTAYSAVLDGKCFFAVYHSDMTPITSYAQKPRDLVEMFHEAVREQGNPDCESMAYDFIARQTFAGLFTEKASEGRLTGIGSFESPVETKGFADGVCLCSMVEPGDFIGYIFRVKEGTDAKAFADMLKSNADPNWQVCATVNTVFAETDGDYVLFMMFDE